MKEDKVVSNGQLRKKKVQRQRLIRGIIQLIFFISMPSAFVAGFSGVKYIFSQIHTGNVIEINSFLLTLIGLGVFTILFGRFFCGYVCAFGSLGDFVYGLSGLIQKKVLKRKKQYALPQKAVLILQKVKYFVLLGIVILCYLGIQYSGSPWDIFSMLTVGKFNFTTVGTVLLIIILLGMGIQERFFCQFLCPMGAVFALLPILPLSVLERNEENCNPNCSLCEMKCPVHLKLEKDSLRLGECIRCGKCTQMCPKENIHSFNGRLSGNELIIVIGKAVIFFVLGITLGLFRF